MGETLGPWGGLAGCEVLGGAGLEVGKDWNTGRRQAALNTNRWGAREGSKVAGMTGATGIEGVAWRATVIGCETEDGQTWRPVAGGALQEGLEHTRCRVRP